MKSYIHLLLAAVLSVMAIGYNAQAQELSEAAVTELMNNSFALLNANRHQEALEGFLKVAEQTKAQRSVGEHQVYACSQTMAVMCHQHLKQYEKAYKLAEKVLDEGTFSDAEKVDLQSLYVTSGYLAALGYMKSSMGRYSDARNLFDKILPYADDDMRQRINRQQPVAWYMEGVAYQKSQRYEEALPCMEKALAAYRSSGISDGEMETLCRIGEIKRSLCNWQGSLSAFREAEKVAADDGTRMQILVEQWKVCDAITDYKTMWDISERMELLASTSKDMSLLFSYNSFRGKQSERQGNYVMAERWYLKNTAMLPRLDNHAQIHKHYVNLRELYMEDERWDEALYNANLANKVLQNCNEPTVADYYIPYISIADIYRHKRDSVNCFKVIDTLFRAIPLTDEPREKVHPYTMRAMAFADFGDFNKALEDYQTADKLLAAKYDSTDDDRMMMLVLIAGMESQLKHYPEAERLYAQYAKLTKAVYGSNSMNHINAVGYLANAEAFAGHIDAAIGDYIDAASMFKELVRSRWPYMISSEREGYWSSSVKLLHNMTPFALKAGECQTVFTEACYNGLILTKAFLLESEQSTYDLIKQNGSSEDLENYSSVQYLLNRIKAWERNGEEYADSILNATTRIKRLESELADRCRAYGDATSFMEIDYTQVKQALGEGDVLVDFTDFVSKERGRVYAAYTVTGKQKYPLLRELFPESSIDSLKVRHPYQYYSGLAGERIYELLWKPLKDDVPEGSTVYYVPSQMLFQIALESIPAEDGALLGDHYHFVRLSSARDLVRYKRQLDVTKVKGRQDAVLYGGLVYTLDDATMAQQSKLYDISRTFAFRGSENLSRGDSLFYDLPGSKEEIEAISRTLKKAGLDVIPYSGKEGTEESFLSLDGRPPHILHLATHGFYYTPNAAQKVDYLRGYTDAMSLSGLVLSGGNAAWLGHELPDNVMGGIVTASDIAKMDLSGVEMVVLSACHSGKGEATPEGLYGLQRAFKKAGAKTIVMSLWAESDIVGPEFMAAFYENLVSGKWDKHKAFDKAKDTMREKYPDTPSYWAGFVMLD